MAFIGHGNLYLRTINWAVFFIFIFAVLLIIQRHAGGSSGDADRRVGGSWFIWLAPGYIFFFFAMIVGWYLLFAKLTEIPGSKRYSGLTIYAWISTPALLFVFTMLLADELNESGIWYGSKSLPTLLVACFNWVAIFWIGSYIGGAISDDFHVDPPLTTDQRDWVLSAEDAHPDGPSIEEADRSKKLAESLRRRDADVSVNVNVNQPK